MVSFSGLAYIIMAYLKFFQGFDITDIQNIHSILR